MQEEEREQREQLREFLERDPGEREHLPRIDHVVHDSVGWAATDSVGRLAPAGSAMGTGRGAAGPDSPQNELPQNAEMEAGEADSVGWGATEDEEAEDDAEDDVTTGGQTGDACGRGEALGTGMAAGTEGGAAAACEGYEARSSQAAAAYEPHGPQNELPQNAEMEPGDAAAAARLTTSGQIRAADGRPQHARNLLQGSESCSTNSGQIVARNVLPQHPQDAPQNEVPQQPRNALQGTLSALGSLLGRFRRRGGRSAEAAEMAGANSHLTTSGQTGASSGSGPGSAGGGSGGGGGGEGGEARLPYIRLPYQPGQEEAAEVVAGPRRMRQAVVTLHPQPSTLNPQPSTLNPQPSTLNPQH